MTMPTIVEVILFFHCLSVYNNGLQKRTLNVPQYNCMRTVIGCYVQRLLKVSRKPFSNAPFTDVFIAMAPYILLTNSICQFRVLVTCHSCLSSLPSLNTLDDADNTLREEDGVDVATFECSASQNDALNSVRCPMYDRLHWPN